MRVLEFLGIEVFALLAMVIFILSWLRSRRKRRLVHEAFFSGGPLDGTSRKLPELPAVFQDHLPKGKVAIYKHQGMGVYLFDDYVYELNR